MKRYEKKPQQIHGNESLPPRTRKQDVNLRKNGWLHFQIGLILSLGIVYFTVEAAFPMLETPEITKLQPDGDLQEDPFVLNEVKPEIPIPDPLPEPQPENASSVGEQIKIIDNNEKDVQETKNIVLTKEAEPDEDLSLGEIDYRVEEKVFSILGVETVPLFPGCEALATNKEKIDCFSAQLNKIISKNFNTTLGAQFGLTGKQRINLVFKIDKSGNITDIKTRAPHPMLAKEAERVIKMIPKLKPGAKSGQPVEVLFAKPIIFMVD
ncbi:energy transducer TonB [Flavobacteriaceae bacterium M23B6Z8]